MSERAQNVLGISAVAVLLIAYVANFIAAVRQTNRHRREFDAAMREAEGRGDGQE